jgi:multicomponent Na+:H+ antiporter subunit E
MVRMPGYAGTFLVLWVFWTILLGRRDWASLLLGTGVCALVTLFSRDLSFRKGEGISLNPRVMVDGLAYLGILLVEIVKANIQVAAVVLNPRLPIAPTIVRFRSQLKTDLGKAALGNSITLTPGTVTIEAAGDTFTVHALTLEVAQAMGDRWLERRLLGIEAGGEARE